MSETAVVEFVTHDELLDSLGPDAHTDLQDLPWTERRSHKLTVENRGLSIFLKRTERLRFRDEVWYGFWHRDKIILRVWHDGSITDEGPDPRASL